jgi:hypothetical protein
MLEHFKPTRTWDHLKQKHRQYQSVICGCCGFSENIPVNRYKPLPPDVIVKSMQKRNWLMGHKRKDDKCPRCANAARLSKAFKT